MDDDKPSPALLGLAIEDAELPSPRFGWALALGGLVPLLGYYLSGEPDAHYSYKFGEMSAGFRLFANVIAWVVSLSLIAGGLALGLLRARLTVDPLKMEVAVRYRLFGLRSQRSWRVSEVRHLAFRKTPRRVSIYLMTAAGESVALGHLSSTGTATSRRRLEALAGRIGLPLVDLGSSSPGAEVVPEDTDGGRKRPDR